MKVRIKILLSIILTLFGGLIYVLYRGKSLLMFSWFESVGLNSVVDYIRNKNVMIEPYYWIKYNLPAGLWLFSYMFIMDAIWGESKSVNRKMFIWILPVIAFLSELMQTFGLCPGTFDILDVVSYLFAIILFKTIRYYEK